MRGHWDFPKWASEGAGAAQVKGLYMSIKVGEGLAVGVDSMVAFKLLSRQPPPPATFTMHEIGLGNGMPLHKCDRIGPRQATELHEHAATAACRDEIDLLCSVEMQTPPDQISFDKQNQSIVKSGRFSKLRKPLPSTS
jgi:hypothetical protein